VVCHYRHGGRLNDIIALVVARVEEIGPVLHDMEEVTVFAPVLLGYTNYGSYRQTRDWEIKFYF
jgi:hypothetical protein